jgi:hypothetical protein
VPLALEAVKVIPMLIVGVWAWGSGRATATPKLIDNMVWRFDWKAAELLANCVAAVLTSSAFAASCVVMTALIATLAARRRARRLFVNETVTSEAETSFCSASAAIATSDVIVTPLTPSSEYCWEMANSEVNCIVAGSAPGMALMPASLSCASDGCESTALVISEDIVNLTEDGVGAGVTKIGLNAIIISVSFVSLFASKSK